MPSLLADTPVGDALRILTRHRYPQYSEDDPQFCATWTSKWEVTKAEEAKTQKPATDADCTASVEEADSREATLCGAVEPAVLVKWYGPDDPENPLNWRFAKKMWLSCCIGFATVSIYLGGATLTTAYTSLRADFGVSEQAVFFSMSLYILCYGAGALIFAPLSELPQVGRNPPNLFPLFFALLFQLAGAISPTFGGVLASRALVGLLGALLLATGGASLCDVWGIRRLPIALQWFWVLPSFCSPGTPPIITVSAVERFGWRWAFWVQSFFIAVGFVLLLFSPETSANNLLYRRALRLRRSTGNSAYTSAAELASRNTSRRQLFYDAFATPLQISTRDPSILFANCYIGFCYGIFFTFFDAFPMVYGEIFRFSTVPFQATFTCVNVGAIIGGAIYSVYQIYYSMPMVEKHGMPLVERRLEPALVSACVLPTGLFIFAWTSYSHLHWAGPLVGAAVVVGANIITFQCVFYYIILAYEANAASCLAANDFIRSAVAAFLVHAATPLFHSRVGIHGGVSLLGGVACLGIPGVWCLYIFGASLRARSRFAKGEERQGKEESV